MVTAGEYLLKCSSQYYRHTIMYMNMDVNINRYKYIIYSLKRYLSFAHLHIFRDYDSQGKSSRKHAYLFRQAFCTFIYTVKTEYLEPHCMFSLHHCLNTFLKCQIPELLNIFLSRCFKQGPRSS